MGFSRILTVGGGRPQGGRIVKILGLGQKIVEFQMNFDDRGGSTSEGSDRQNPWFGALGRLGLAPGGAPF